MYKARRRLMRIGTEFLASIGIIILIAFLVPHESFWFTFAVAAIIFCFFDFTARKVYSLINVPLEYKSLHAGETSILSRFTERLRACYSLDDFFTAIRNVLEDEADCSVLYVDRENNYVIYNSPDRLTCSDAVMQKLALNYTKIWPNGTFFFDSNFGTVSEYKNTRGFFMVNGKMHLYIFCKYTRLFDQDVYPLLYEELCRFQKRAQTINELGEIAGLSKEWSLLAETQVSFLPRVMPKTAKLDIDAYFRPLVNVSGDYYTVLPMDENRTLVMLGDVSGKGLAAALVMGLVMNTVKIIENKNDLAGVVTAVDHAIKGMHLQDKYTVLFIGIIDTAKMNIRYINASMSDPLVLTKENNEFKIIPLSSNCSIVGIIDLDELVVSEQSLCPGDVILMASDGVSEVMDDSGTELGDTELYKETLKNSAYKSATHFIGDIADLVLSYNGNKKLRDDVTMLVAKVEGN